MLLNAIDQQVVIGAPIETVWEVLTDPSNIARWFTDDAVLDLRPGGRGTLTWKNYGSSEIVVVEVDRPRRFVYRWGHPEGAEPVDGNSLLVEFTLTILDVDSTILRIVETGVDAMEWDDARKSTYTEGHIDGWQGHLGRFAALAPTVHQRNAAP